VTGSAPGFTSDTVSVNYVQPALEIINLPTSPTASSTNTDFVVRVGVAAANNVQLQQIFPRRAGAPALTVTVTNSQPTVAEIDQNGGVNGAQSQTAAIAAGQSNTPNNTAGGLEFDPLSAGSTVVTATIPGFITTTNGSKTVTVQ